MPKERRNHRCNPMSKAPCCASLEKKLQRPQIRASAAEVAGLLADEFFEFGASGSVWSRNKLSNAFLKNKNTTSMHKSQKLMRRCYGCVFSVPSYVRNAGTVSARLGDLSSVDCR